MNNHEEGRRFEKITETPLKPRRDFNYPLLGLTALAGAGLVGGAVVCIRNAIDAMNARAAAQSVADAEAARKSEKEEAERREHELALEQARARDAIAAARSDATAAIGSLTQAQQALEAERQQRVRAEREAAALQKRQTLIAQAYRDALEISRLVQTEVEVQIEAKVREVAEKEGEEWAQVYADALMTHERAMRANLSQLAENLDQEFQRRLREAKDDATRAAMIAQNELGIAPEVISEFNDHTLLDARGTDSCQLPNGALSEGNCTVFRQFRTAGQEGTLRLMYDANGNPWPDITRQQADRFVASMIRQFGGNVNPKTMQRFQAGVENALAREDQRTTPPQQR